MPESLPTVVVVSVVGALASVVVVLYKAVVGGYDRQLKDMQSQIDRANRNADRSSDQFQDLLQANKRTVRLVEDQQK